MGWWRLVVDRVRSRIRGRPRLGPEERVLLGEPLEIEAEDVDLRSPLGPVRVPFVVRAGGRIKCLLRLEDLPHNGSPEVLLRRLAGVHWALPDAEICPSGPGRHVPRLLGPYLRPGRGARIELDTWLLAESGDPRPLARAIERHLRLRLEPNFASLGRVATLLREELGRDAAHRRSAAPAARLLAELTRTVGSALQDELGGELDRTGRTWSRAGPDGRFELDLLRWVELWLDRVGGEIETLGRELGRHLADPAYLLDPPAFVASRWTPPPGVGRAAGGLELPLLSFIELRAEAVLQQGAETPDAGDVVLECPGCHGLSAIATVYSSAEGASLDTLVLALYEQLYTLEQVCPACSISLSSRDFRVARYFRLLPDVGLDLALQLGRADDGRIASRLRLFSADGRTRECSQISEQAARNLTGRCLSGRAGWLDLLERARISGQVESLAFDGSSIGFVVPRGASDVRQRLEAVVARTKSQGEWLKIRLSDLDREDLPFLEGTYHEWAGPFGPALEDGSLVALMLVDLHRAKQRFLETLQRVGATTAPEGDSMAVRLGRHRVEVPLQSRLIEAVHTGRLVEERAMATAAEALTRLRKLEAFLSRIRSICGQDKEYLYDPASGMLRVLAAGGSEGTTFNLHSLLLKFGGDEEQLERMVRAMSGEEELSLERCRCGAPAYVSLKMKPPEWASAHPGSVEVVFERHNGVIFAYSIDCEEHSGYINRDSMDRLGLSLAELRSRFQEDLDQNDYQIGLLVLRDGPWPALGIVGTNAASLACHPALVRRALEMARIDLGSRVRLHARSTDAIVVTEAAAGLEFLESVAAKLDHILSQSLGLSSGRLRFDELVDLPAGGRGRLREVFRLSRP
jgi:hypothetical protein